MNKFTALDGWMLDAVVEYDKKYPGFAGHYLRASSERRQTIAALFSTGRHAESDTSISGEFLASAKHNAILTAAFREIPSGFRRALAKSGPKPHEPSYYSSLRDTLASGSLQLVNVVRQSQALNPDRIEIIKSLPFDLCDIRIVARIESLRQARDLAAVVEFYDNRTSKRDELVAALLASQKTLSSVMRRWCRRIKYNDHPIPRSERYRPIVDGVELHAVARRYQNCSRNYTVSAMIGESAFGEYRSGGAHFLLYFEKHKGIWTLEGVYSRRNRNIKEAIEIDARKFVETYGILGRWDVLQSDNALEKVLQRVIRPYTDW